MTAPNVGPTLRQVVDAATLQQPQSLSPETSILRGSQAIRARWDGFLGCNRDGRTPARDEPQVHTSYEGVAADTDRERTIFWAVWVRW